MERMDLIYSRRPRQVVKSETTNLDFDFNIDLIDRVLGTPDKIDIPDRYIPEQERLEPEEQLRRNQKAEAICRLLSKSSVVPLPIVFPLGGPSTARSRLNSRNSSLLRGESQSDYYPDQYGQLRGDGGGEEEEESYEDKGDYDFSQLSISGQNGHQHRRLNSFTSSHSSLPFGQTLGQKRLSSINNTASSVPGTPVRRAVSIRRNPPPPPQRTSSAYCDWSLAGVSVSPSSTYKTTQQNRRFSSDSYTSPPQNRSHDSSGYITSRSLNHSSISSYPHSSSPNPSNHARSYSSSSSSKSSDREDFLHLQQDIAREVTQRSRLVAVKALASSPAPGSSRSRSSSSSYRYRPPSPPSPVDLPTVQQREGFLI